MVADCQTNQFIWFIVAEFPQSTGLHLIEVSIAGGLDAPERQICRPDEIGSKRLMRAGATDRESTIKQALSGILTVGLT